MVSLGEPILAKPATTTLPAVIGEAKVTGQGFAVHAKFAPSCTNAQVGAAPPEGALRLAVITSCDHAALREKIIKNNAMIDLFILLTMRASLEGIFYNYSDRRTSECASHYRIYTSSGCPACI